MRRGEGGCCALAVSTTAKEARHTSRVTIARSRRTIGLSAVQVTGSPDGTPAVFRLLVPFSGERLRWGFFVGDGLAHRNGIPLILPMPRDTANCVAPANW